MKFWAVIIIGVAVFGMSLTAFAVWYWKKHIKQRPRRSIKGRHVVITGGSSGIGKSIAIVAALRGAHVTIIARNYPSLLEVQYEVKRHRKSSLSQRVHAVSADVTNPTQVKRAFQEAEQVNGPIYMLVNCAGYAMSGQLEELSLPQIKNMISINFLGSVVATREVIPMMKRHKEGIIVLTGSQASLVGIFGYSVYAGTKFALRGVAECLAMELKPYNVSVTLAVPPDTDTPGFAHENLTKPDETRQISETAGLFDPFDVAYAIVDDALSRKFFSFQGFESGLVTYLSAGMSPVTHFREFFFQLVFYVPLRLISLFYQVKFEEIVQKGNKKRVEEEMRRSGEQSDNESDSTRGGHGAEE